MHARTHAHRNAHTVILVNCFIPFRSASSFWPSFSIASIGVRRLRPYGDGCHRKSSTAVHDVRRLCTYGPGAFAHTNAKSIRLCTYGPGVFAHTKVKSIRVCTYGPGAFAHTNAKSNWLCTYGPGAFSPTSAKSTLRTATSKLSHMSALWLHGRDCDTI